MRRKIRALELWLLGNVRGENMEDMKVIIRAGLKMLYFFGGGSILAALMVLLSGPIEKSIKIALGIQGPQCLVQKFVNLFVTKL